MNNPHTHLPRFPALIAAGLMLAAGLAPLRAEETVKLRVESAAISTALQSKGATVLADYGSYQVISTPISVAAPYAADPAVQSREEDNIIELNYGPLDTRRPEIKALQTAVPAFTGKRLHLIQFAGPVKPEWHDELRGHGVQVITYLPRNAYLVYGDSTALGRLQASARTAKHIQWDGAFVDDYKIHPDARQQTAKGPAAPPPDDLFEIQMVEDDGANPETLRTIDAVRLEAPRSQTRLLNYVTTVVKLPGNRLTEIATRPEVLSIRRYIVPTKKDERQNQIIAGNLSGTGPSGPGYLAWITAKGFSQAQFNASGFAVDVTDSGIDNGTTRPGHFGLFVSGNTNLASRVVYNRLIGTPNSGSTIQGLDGHGNLNSHIIAGFNNRSGFPFTDAAGYSFGLGVAPWVRVGSSTIFDPNNFTFPNFSTLQSRAYTNGARISANSWGAAVGGAYTANSQSYDALVRDAQPTGSVAPAAGNQEMVIVFAAGNSGSGANTIGSPATAKNVITVGATENVHPHTTAAGGNNVAGNDGCNTADTGANSANDIIGFSSRGPCDDGRFKPEIVAPGTHVTGGVGQQFNTGANGNALVGFMGSGVCALPGGGSAGSTNNFFPLGQQFYTTSSGTSHSCPAVAGAAALLRQYFINRGSNPPSPALTKAWLVNSSRYLNGVGANDTLPSNNQGMGDLNLGMGLDGVTRLIRDQNAADLFTASGQTRTFLGTITDSTKPFRVTVSWTDAPGSTVGNAYKNDLDLTVTVGGQTYRGNQFSGGNSITGGSADPRNNTESVFLPAGLAGNFTVTITAANINSDGVPGNASAIDQDFGLVVYNGRPGQNPVIAGVRLQLTAENCIPANAVPDPNERVTMNLTLTNLSASATINLTATLVANGSVVSPSAPQNFGVLTGGGASATRAFSFTVAGICGGLVTNVFNLTDGAASLGTATFVTRIGESTVTTLPRTQPGAVTITDNTTATPYPSSLVVSGVAGTITRLQVVLTNLSHSFPGDMDVLLVGPSGQTVMLMSDAGGSGDINNVTLTFDDAGPLLSTSQIFSGTYRPTDLSSGDSLPGPAPVGPYGSTLATFNGQSPNGTWRLYIDDDTATDSGILANGWRLVITTETFNCCTNIPYADNVYLRSTAGAPWGQTTNEALMTRVFGAGNWQDLRYEAVSVASLLSSNTAYIYCEGSDNNALAMGRFLSNNIVALQNWVAAGGRLFINAAPNEGGNQSLGFGVSLTYGAGTTTGTGTNTAAGASHPVFAGPYNPVGRVWTGNSFAHAGVSGGGVNPLIVNHADPSRIVLGEKAWGAGRVLFGGMTTPNFHSPQPESGNLRANIIAYNAFAPCILQQPISRSVYAGSSVGFTVRAEGAQPLNYQWQQNGVDIPGENAQTLTLSDVAFADAGTYRVRVSNAFGSILSSAATLTVLVPLTAPAYFRSVVGAPWAAQGGEASQTNALNRAFGINGWQDLRYETTTPGIWTSLLANTRFIYFEGSDANTLEMSAFLSANVASLQNWVSGGGRLFINAAPNEGANQNLGFGVTLTYGGVATGNGVSVANTHPVFNKPFTPVGTSWTASSFAHAIVSGGLTPIIVNAAVPANVVLGEKLQGTGLALFGGMTTDNFHSPQLQASNLRANILTYTAYSPIITDQPDSATVLVSQPVSLSVAVAGRAPFTYQWFRNGSPIGGANEPTYTLASPQVSHTGNYTVAVSNAWGGVVSSVAVLTVNPIPTTPAYVRSAVGSPWGQNRNEAAMSRVFGSGNWQDLRFESVYVPLLFSTNTPFVYLEGGDSSADELRLFITNNLVAIQTYVSAGGRMWINTAPNEGSDFSLGFGVTMRYPLYLNSVTSAVPAHPVFNGPFQPVGRAWTGSAFAHGVVTGGTVRPLIVAQGSTDQFALAEKAVDLGKVLFGAITSDNFHQPETESTNLTAGIIGYTALSPTIMQQPSNVVAIAGSTVNLNVSVRGGTPLRYRWTRNGSTVGPNNATLSLANVQAANAGDYRVVITNAWGSVTSTIATLTVLTPGTNAAYVRSSTGLPWGSTANETAMNRVFGAGRWQDLRYETVNATNLLSTNTSFLFLEGSDFTTTAFATFINNNMAALESWVVGGGRLILNAAPNTPGNVNLGFGVTLNYPDFTPTGGVVRATHPLATGPFTPVGTQWSGGYFGHASISGPNVTTLITNLQNGRVILGEQCLGAGLVVFGGLTTDNFHQPQPEAGDLRANLIAYAAGVATVSSNAPPAITLQPDSQTVIGHTPVSFLVGVCGAPTLRYQWRRNGINLLGANGPSYSIPDPTTANNGNYTVVITNSFGSVTSAVAVLTVTNGPLSHFTFSGIASPKTVFTPFAASLTARDALNNVVPSFTGSVSLEITNGSLSIFAADFEDGLEGFTLNNGVGVGGGLWHRSVGRGFLAGHSKSNSLYYGTGETVAGGGSYNTGNSEGNAVSPVINLVGQIAPLQLSFNHFIRTEGNTNFDRATVAISTNGGANWITITGNHTGTNRFTDDSGGVWINQSYDVSILAGKPQARIRFRFETGDDTDNNFEGWYIDDITISRPLHIPVLPAVAGPFVNGVWSGSITVCSPGTGLRILADDGAGHTGVSGAFNVTGSLPRLRILRAEPFVTLAWPNVSPAFQLQATTNLTPPRVWVTVPGAPSLILGTNYLNDTTSGRQKYYRLFKP